MSLTPADESDARGSSVERAAERDESGWSIGARVGRLGARLRSLCLRTVRRVRRSFEPPEEEGDAQLVRRADGEPDRRLARYSEASADPPRCPSVSGLPARERPLTFPARDTDTDNRPDLVVKQTEEEVIVAVPGEPGTAIRSDTWDPVEP